jgi:hypothetical protein
MDSRTRQLVESLADLARQSGETTTVAPLLALVAAAEAGRELEFAALCLKAFEDYMSEARIEATLDHTDLEWLYSLTHGGDP